MFDLLHTLRHEHLSLGSRNSQHARIPLALALLFYIPKILMETFTIFTVDCSYMTPRSESSVIFASHDFIKR